MPGGVGGARASLAPTRFDAAAGGAPAPVGTAVRRWPPPADPTSRSAGRCARARPTASERQWPGVLVLFDIDGTLLLRAAQAHARAIHEALREVYGVAASPGRVEAAGRTDLDIARALALLAGVDAERFDAGARDLRVAATAAYARLVPRDLSAHV